MMFLVVALMTYALAGWNLHLYMENSYMLNLVAAVASFGVGQVCLPEALRRLKESNQ